MSLPTWKANVGYEEGEDWVLSKMKTGYPRFFIHLTIQELEKEILQRYARAGQRVMIFPSSTTARRCQSFIYDKVQSLQSGDVHILGLVPIFDHHHPLAEDQTAVSKLYCVFFPAQHFLNAKQVWQHTGDGISSRRGEFCLAAFHAGLLVPESETLTATPQHDSSPPLRKGPRRYRRGESLHDAKLHTTDHLNGETSGSDPHTNSGDTFDSTTFVEERFGRNLNVQLANKAKLAIRRRIAGSLGEHADLDEALDEKNTTSTSAAHFRAPGLTEDDVYLYPTGMSAIFNAHQTLLASSQTPNLKSICFGFPYIDTLKVLQKWGAGALFYGHGTDSDISDLESRLLAGERYLALFTEFPSNPLLRSPDLPRLSALCAKYSIALVIDESIGNFINVDILPHSTIVVSSLTKVFSGDSNVMGGSLVLNPVSPMYSTLKSTLESSYADNYFPLDAIYLERNSRDFISRIHRINTLTHAIATQLQASPIVKTVYYPPFTPSAHHYETCRRPTQENKNYGGLLSVTFQSRTQAVAFFDTLRVHKGPSLGTNFTLACPFVILAHYGELDWCEGFGVERDLVRISFGLEGVEDMKGRVAEALEAAARVGSDQKRLK